MTRIADLGYAARAFAELDAEHDLDGSLARLRALLVGYDASPQDRTLIVPAMIERAEAMRDLLLTGAATGTQPWAALAADGHAGDLSYAGR